MMDSEVRQDGEELGDFDIQLPGTTKGRESAEKKFKETVEDYQSLITLYLGAIDVRERAKLGDKLSLVGRYMRVRRRLLFPDYPEPELDEDDENFPEGTIYGSNKDIDPVIEAQIDSYLGHLPLDEKIAKMDLVMQQEIQEAITTEDQGYFLAHTRRICLLADRINDLLTVKHFKKSLFRAS